MKKLKILIDNGHGIETPGKRSPDGKFLEYLFNRKVAQRVVDGLRRLGIDADLVVPETNDIPLKTRVLRVNNICKEIGAENVILISIHSNAAGNGREWTNAKGWSCYTTKGKTESDAIAENLYHAFSEIFLDKKMRRDYIDGDSDIEQNFYLLQKTKCPAVLIENFFYDNLEECRWLLEEGTYKDVAFATIMGIQQYIDSL